MSNDISHLLRRDACPRCLEPVSKNQPSCGACDSALPWFDDAVGITLRDLKTRHAREYSQAARHWKAERVRLNAPRRFALAAPLALGAGVTVLLGAALLLARPAASTRSAQFSGALCVDGSESRATTSGACSGHGGVANWLK